MHPNIANLQDNFTEIYHVVKHPESTSLPLVANLSGTRIYDARYAWGRLWTWIYQLGSWITGNDYRIDKLKQAVIHTQSLFNTFRTTADKHLKQYIHLIKKAGKGYAYNENAFLISREVISTWSNTTRPFIKILASPLAARFKRLLNYTFGESSSPHFFDGHFEASGHCRRIVDAEGIYESPLPYAILNKVIKGKQLNASEKKDLAKWIDKTNTLDISPGMLHKVLLSLSLIYAKNASEATSEEDIVRIELSLEEMGLNTFTKDDPKQIVWRDSLKPGSKIKYHSMTLTIVKEAFPDVNGSDATRVFFVKELPAKVALIGKNKVLMGLRKIKMEQLEYPGIKSAHIDDIADDKSFAIMDRLFPVSLTQELAGSGADFTDFKMRSSLIAGLIAKMVREHQTPAAFNPSSLMMNDKGELLTLKPLKPGPFDFNALEDFVHKCSGGNRDIFRSLMNESGLLDSDTAHFYDEYVKMSLKGEIIPVADLAGIYKITDPKIVDRCTELVQQIKSKKMSLYTVLRAHFPHENPAVLSKKIDSAIIECKRSSCTAGTLWPSFETDVLTQCTNGRLPAALLVTPI